MNKNNHNFINFASAEQPEKHTHSRTWCVWQLVWLLDPLAFGPKVLLIALRRPPIKSKPTALSWDLMTYPLPHGQLLLRPHHNASYWHRFVFLKTNIT